MPLPPSPRRGRHTRAKLLAKAKAKVTPADIQAQLSSTAPALVPRPLAKGTEANHKLVIKMFDEWLGPPRNIEIHGHVPLSFDQYIKIGLPFPSLSHVKSFFTYWATGSIGFIEETVSAKYLVEQYFRLCAIFRRATGVLVPSEARALGLRGCVSVIKDLDLQYSAKVVSRLDATSIRALQKCSLLDSWQWRKNETIRLHLLFYIAVASQTAARPGAIVKPRGEARDEQDNRLGCSFGDFDLWAIRSQGRSNEVHGHFQPRHGKTSHSRNKSLPIPPAVERIMDSASLLLFIQLYVQRKVSAETIRTWLDPSFCDEVEKRRISFPPSMFVFTPEGTDRSQLVPVLRHNSGTSLTTLQITRALGHQSIHMGFEIAANAYSFRHLGAWALDQAGGEEGHVSAHRCQCYDIHRETFASLPSDSVDVRARELGPAQGLSDGQTRRQMTSLNAQPDDMAPNVLTVEEKMRVEEHDNLKQLASKRKIILAELDTNQDPEQIKRLKVEKDSNYHATIHMRKMLQGDVLQEKRTTYFNDKRKAGPSAYRQIEPAKTLSIFDHLYLLLCRPPDDVLLIFDDLIKSLDQCFHGEDLLSEESEQSEDEIEPEELAELIGDIES